MKFFEQLGSVWCSALERLRALQLIVYYDSWLRFSGRLWTDAALEWRSRLTIVVLFFRDVAGEGLGRLTTRAARRACLVGFRAGV